MDRLARFMEQQLRNFRHIERNRFIRSRRSQQEFMFGLQLKLAEESLVAGKINVLRFLRLVGANRRAHLLINGNEIGNEDLEIDLQFQRYILLKIEEVI